MTLAPAILKLDPEDHVGVATRALRAGEALDGVFVAEDIPAGHKVATRSLAAGDIVRKYGQPIGQATRDIGAGAHVHVHNLVATRPAEGGASRPPGRTARIAVPPASFKGFPRPDGNTRRAARRP